MPSPDALPIGPETSRGGQPPAEPPAQTPAAGLIDPEVFRWTILWRLTKAGGDSTDERLEFRRDEISAYQWVPMPPPPDVDFTANWMHGRRVWLDPRPAKWIGPVDGLQRMCEPIANLDTLIIKTGCARKGRHAPPVWAELAENQWQAGYDGSADSGASPDAQVDGEPPAPPKGSGAFAAVLAFELLTAEVDPDLTVDSLRIMARDAISSREADPAIHMEEFATPAGQLYLVPELDEVRPVTLLLTPRSSDALAARTYFQAELFPYIQIARLKCLAMAGKFRAQRKGEVYRRTLELDQSLRQFALRARKGSIESLEEVSWKIARIQPDFAEVLSTGQEILQTLKVNLENLEALLKDPCFGAAGEALARSWLDPLRLVMRQVESDLVYDEITRDQAASVLEGISTIGAIRADQASRTLNKILAIVAVMAIPQVFAKPVWLDVYPEVVWRLGLVAVFGLMAYFVIRRFEVGAAPRRLGGDPPDARRAPPEG